MKRKIINSLLIAFIFSIGAFITNVYQSNFKHASNIIMSQKENKNNNNKIISMMFETEEDSGIYEAVTDESWPTSGYTFNAEISKCQNGSEITYDFDNNKVKVRGNKSDKCYVYFDLGEGSSTGGSGGTGGSGDGSGTFAAKIKSLYTTDGEDGLYLHDGSGTYTNASLEAGDGSYRYAGSDPANYVCFGSTETACPTENLYRIIGVFGDQVKLIKYDYATDDMLGTTTKYATDFTASSYTNYKGALTTIPSHYWSGSSSNSVSDWETSTFNTMALNTSYLTYLTTAWTDLIETTDWYVAGGTEANLRQSNALRAYSYELGSNATKSGTYTSSNGKSYNVVVSAKIGLMYVSEYYYAAAPTYWSKPGYSDVLQTSDYRVAIAENWLYMGVTEWTLSRITGYTNLAFNVNYTGYAGYFRIVTNYAMRPSFNLKSAVTYAGGSGTNSDPYRIAL